MDALIRRGRKRTYLDEDRQHFAALIREHGLRGAREALRRKVSPKTLRIVATEFQVVLKKGRRPAPASSPEHAEGNRNSR